MWRSFHSEELHSMVHLIYHVVRVLKYRRLRCGDHVARIEEGKSFFKILTGTPTEKIPLGRPKRRREKDIMDHKEIGINRLNFLI